MVKEELREAIMRLASRMPFKVNSIVLFGSHARSEDLPWSDVDLLVISEGFSGMRKSDRIGLVLERWGYAKPVEPVCLAPNEVSIEDPLIWEVCRDGVIVIDDGTFSAIKTACLTYLAKNKVRRLKYGYIMQE